MLDLMGSGYVIDHCIAAINERHRRENYEFYITDIAYVLLNGLYQNKLDFPRYYDILNPKPKDERTGEEIAADIIKRHGLKVVG